MKNQNIPRREYVEAAPRGPDHCHWKGGSSFGKYCYKFNDRLKEEVRTSFNRKCVLCNCSEDEKEERQSVHHITFDKKSGCYGKKWNLIPVCRKCHSWTSHHRFESFNKLMNWWAVNPSISLTTFPFSNLYIDYNYKFTRGQWDYDGTANDPDEMREHYIP